MLAHLLLAVVLWANIAASYINEVASKDQADSLQLAGLGRPFSLGALYDARNDQLVAPGVTLWSQDSLSKNVFEQNMPNTDTEIVAKSSFEAKANSLNVHAELKASFLAGMVKVSGAANYLNEAHQSNYMAEVSFRYHARTHMRKLTMDHLAHIDYPEVFDTATEATHIVTQIEYGANAVFKFNQDTNSYDKREEVQGKLGLDVQAVFGKISGEGSLNLTDKQKKDYSSYSCKFLGDVSLPEPPTTFVDAIKDFMHLPSLIDKTTTIPIVVYLYPLSKLDSKALRIVRKISRNLLKEVEDRMNAYDGLSQAIGDLEHSSVYAELPLFQGQVQNFKEALEVHRGNFQTKLLRVLPSIRGAGMEEIELVKALDESTMPYTIAQLTAWTRWKQAEAGALNALASTAPDVIVTKPGAFELLLFNPDIEYILSFTLQLYTDTDSFTECIKHNCGFNSSNPTFCNKLNCDQVRNYNSWLQNRELSAEFRRVFTNYLRIVQFNQDIKPPHSGRESVLIIREVSVLKSEQSIFIELYQDGNLLEGDFALPAMGQLAIKERSCKGTTLAWGNSTSSSKLFNPGSFAVQYRKLNSTKWVKELVQAQSIVLPLVDDFEVAVGGMCTFGVCGERNEVFEVSPKLNCNKCLVNPCAHGGTCSIVPGPEGNYTCTCASGWVGNNCQTDVDECLKKPCQHGSVCKNTPGSYTCTCAKGFTGRNCEIDIDECLSKPCQHGARKNAGSGYPAKCQIRHRISGWPDIRSDPCGNTEGSYFCACPSGWTGTNCQTDINECLHSPCQHGAKCTNTPGSYTCACPSGWKGKNCETPINACVLHPCLNGGTCVVKGAGYACNCVRKYWWLYGHGKCISWSGTNCEKFRDMYDC